MGNIMLDTGYHQLALITLTLRFSRVSDMLMHMLAHSYGLTDRAVLNIMDAITRGDYDTALKLLRPYYMITFLGRIITTEFDTVNFEIKHKMQVFLGQFNWSNIFTWGAIGCGLAVIGVIAIAVVTAGFGAVKLPLVLGACIGGGALGMGLSVLTSASSDKPETIKPYVDALDDEGKRAKEQNEEYYKEALRILMEWLKQNKITQDDFNRLVSVLDSWKMAMDSAIDDIVNMSKKAIEKAYEDGYKDGYKKGVEESKTWIALSGIGGLLVGYMMGRR
jgi:hypothetical protein